MSSGTATRARMIHGITRAPYLVDTPKSAGSEFGGSHSTNEDAVATGRARAQQYKTEHVIHNQDGTISERNSYGNDPASRPG